MIRLHSQTALFAEALKKVTVKGLYLEFGLFMGRTATKICRFIPPDQILYAFDSFKGVSVQFTPKIPAGVCSLWELPKYPDNVRIIVGDMLPNTTPFCDKHPEHIAFLHIDVAYYKGAYGILQALTAKGKIIKGTIIVITQYRYLEDEIWYTEMERAWLNYVKDFNINYEVIVDAYDTRHRAFIIKGT